MTVHVPKALLLLLLLVLVGGGAAVGGYLLGRDSVDKRRIERNAYERGRAAGFKAGNSQGFAKGQKASEEDADFIGENAASLILGGVEPEEDKFFIVRFDRVRNLIVPWVINESYGVTTDTLYSVCADGDSICERPAF